MAAIQAEIDLTRGIYRRVYSGFVNGKRICSVSIGAEAWFWRLTALADDFGNLYAEPEALCIAARGRRKSVGVGLSERWVTELMEAKLILAYEVGDERFIHIDGFTDSQPAGRNGRRVRRVPEVSGGIQGNPGEPCKSVQPHTHTHTHEEFSPSEEKEQKAKHGPKIPDSLSGSDFSDAWAAWVAHRRCLNLSELSPQAVQAAWARFVGWGLARTLAALRFSVEKNAKNIIEPDQERTSDNGHPGGGGKAEGGAGGGIARGIAAQRERDARYCGPKPELPIRTYP